MESRAVSCRVPLSHLPHLVPTCSNEVLTSLSQKFDMFRCVKSLDATSATHYAALEYLLRPTVQYSEFAKYFAKLPKHIQDGLQGDMANQNPLEVLETLVTCEDLSGMPRWKILVKTYFVSMDTLVSRVQMPAHSMRLPTCYLFVSPEVTAIMYTPLMTVLDGFCPQSGAISKISTVRAVIERAHVELFKNKRARRRWTPNLVRSTRESGESITPTNSEERASRPVLQPPKNIVIQPRSAFCEACRIF